MHCEILTAVSSFPAPGTHSHVRPASLRTRNAEHELLLCCARTSLDQETQCRVEELVRVELNWDYVLRTAEQHGLIPLLCSNLTNKPYSRAVPAALLSHLQDRFRRNAISNLLLTSEMTAVLSLLNSWRIAAIPFKGPTLAAIAYGDLALRQFGDVDILVHKKDAGRARGTLISKGYRPELSLTQRQEKAYIAANCEFGFRNQIYLEIQWELVPKSYSLLINDDVMWRRVEHILVEDVLAPTLSSEDLLLILCVHGTKQSWSRLSWVTDVAELLRARSNMDWEYVMERARGCGAERLLLLGLHLANKFLGAALPDSITQRVSADSSIARLAGQVRERLFRDCGNAPRVLRDSMFYIRARERISDRIRCGIRMTMAPSASDVTFLQLPSLLFFLYYLLRPIRLIWKYLLELSKRSLSGAERIVR